jgi:hypothetical protein
MVGSSGSWQFSFVEKVKGGKNEALRPENTLPWERITEVAAT